MAGNTIAQAQDNASADKAAKVDGGAATESAGGTGTQTADTSGTVSSESTVSAEAATSSQVTTAAAANSDRATAGAAADTTTQNMASNAVSGSDTTKPTTEEANTTDTTQPEAAQPATAPQSSPTVLMSDASGVRVLQGPGDGAATLGAISFGAGGAAQLSGRGSPGGFVRVYLDDASVALAPIGPDGSWQVEIADLSSGILRLDEVDAGGQVIARVETAFERPESATAAMTPATAEEQPAPQVAKGVTRVTVERGSTLWAIAREKYGDGVMYVRVFEANRDLIRDPDLIYPGQVFTLPE